MRLSQTERDSRLIRKEFRRVIGYQRDLFGPTIQGAFLALAVVRLMRSRQGESSLSADYYAQLYEDLVHEEGMINY